MANVSGGSPTNRVKVSNTKAEYHSNLTEEYMNKTKEYMEICLINSERSQTQYEEITSILSDLPAQKTAMITEITNAGDDKLEDIAEAAEPLIAEAKDWANKLGDTVDGTEYSAKHYAELTVTEHTQAISDIARDLAGAKNEIETTRATAVSSVKSAETTGINNVNSTKTTAITEINTKKNEVTTGIQNKYNECVISIDDQSDAVVKNCDRLYKGVDLEVKFASEIATYGNVYKWLEARKNAGNYDGIHVGDYFYTSLKAGTIAEYSITAQTFKCRIIGLNTYKNCGDSVIGNMIYVSTDEVINTPIKWNPADNNNGTNNRKSPWLASAMYAILNGGNNYDNTSGYNKVAHGANGGNGIISLLPTELQSVLKQKRNILDERYSASGLITGGTGWNWADMGKLWLPSEIEVYGTQIRSNLCQTDGYWNPEAGLSIQFPWFANSCEHRIKKRSDGARCSWWLSSVASRSTAHVCNVSHHGRALHNVAAYATIYVPLCFCI